ncbi:MAG: hypothetical protein R3E48_23435 [Burkholderiaceae bacterium]
MRAILLPICTAVAMSVGIAGASAQQTAKQDQSKNSATESKMEQSGMGHPKSMTQSQLRDALQKAGFKSITILDAAYLVQAQTGDGDRVMMMINPPAVGGSNTASTDGEGSAATGAGAGSDDGPDENAGNKAGGSHSGKSKK